MEEVLMKQLRSLWHYHLIAILVVLTWGVTFVNSKVLLNHGLEAHEIFTLRFLLAYVCMWIFFPRQFFAGSWKDEGLMALLGITGGSLYFVTENMAVKIGYVNNVSFIVCSAPLLSMLLALAVFRDVKATRRLVGGSLLSVFGIALVIFNGQIILKLNPLGDALALTASLCWAVYTLLLKKLSHYGSAFITAQGLLLWSVDGSALVSVMAQEFPFAGSPSTRSAWQSAFLRCHCEFCLLCLVELGEPESWSFGREQLCLSQPRLYGSGQCGGTWRASHVDGSRGQRDDSLRAVCCQRKVECLFSILQVNKK